MIRPVTRNDVQDICDIYNYFVENTSVSFEEKIISFNEMAQRIEIQCIDYPWLVYEEAGKVIAYVYANKWQIRSAYRFTLESTIYLSPDHTGKGIGTQLYQALFEELSTLSVRSVMAVIALPNPASVGLHEKMGFKKVAHFKEVGYKHKKWIDVGYWQKIINE